MWALMNMSNKKNVFTLTPDVYYDTKNYLCCETLRLSFYSRFVGF